MANNIVYETADRFGTCVKVFSRDGVFKVGVAATGGFYIVVVKKTLRGAISAANKLAA